MVKNMKGLPGGWIGQVAPGGVEQVAGAEHGPGEHGVQRADDLGPRQFLQPLQHTGLHVQRQAHSLP